MPTITRMNNSASAGPPVPAKHLKDPTVSNKNMVIFLITDIIQKFKLFLLPNKDNHFRG